MPPEENGILSAGYFDTDLTHTHKRKRHARDCHYATTTSSTPGVGLGAGLGSRSVLSLRGEGKNFLAKTPRERERGFLARGHFGVLIDGAEERDGGEYTTYYD